MKIRACFLLFVAVLGSLPVVADQPDLTALTAKAAQGDAQAELDLGRAYHLGKGVPQDFTKASNFYRQAAAQGNAKAMYNLGYMYDHAQGVAQDPAEAIGWFQKSADAGLPAGQLQIGFAFYLGDHGYQQNYSEALKWFTLAAGQPDHPTDNTTAADAANALGNIYEYGRGVPADGKQAVAWYTMGAEMGLAKAQANLGRVYENGMAVKRDNAQSYKWLKLAAFQGDSTASHLLPEFLAAKEFSSGEIAEGDRLVKEYQMKRHQPTNVPLVVAQDPEVPAQHDKLPKSAASTNAVSPVNGASVVVPVGK